MENHQISKYKSNPIVKEYDVRQGNFKERQVVSKRFSGLYYVYENFPNYKWIWVANDDNLIDLETTSKYINSLLHQYDPDKEIVVKGSCVGLDPPFLQGGTGFLMSRYAAKLILKNFDSYMKNDFHQYPEDFAFNKLIHILNISFDTCSAPMIGHGFPSLDHFKYENMKNCKGIKNIESKCFIDPLPIEDIIGYHDNNIIEGYEHLRNLQKLRGKNVKWYNLRYSAGLCKN